MSRSIGQQSVNDTDVVIELIDTNNEISKVVYDVANANIKYLTGEEMSFARVGGKILSIGFPWQNMRQFNVSPENPSKKRGPFKLIKIQLGLKCNFKCNYCSQKKERDEQSKYYENPSIEDVSNFIINLKNNLLISDDVKFEIWGGEPFVYWSVFKSLLEELSCEFPYAEFSAVTNGSLINLRNSQWVLEQDRLQLTISHDGSGNDRDFDVLKNIFLRKLYRDLKAQGRYLIFNCVLTKNNYNISAIKEYIARQLSVDSTEIVLTTEGLAMPANDMDFKLDDSAKASIFNELVSGRSLHEYKRYIQEFLMSLKTERPAYTIEQKCGLDRSDSIVINFQSQKVVTCQNLLPTGRHDLGNINSISEVRLNTVWHWRSRLNCGKCPMLIFCRGGCLHLDSAEFEKLCHTQFDFYLPILSAAIFYLTGKTPISMKSWRGVIDLSKVTNCRIS